MHRCGDVAWRGRTAIFVAVLGLLVGAGEGAGQGSGKGAEPGQSPAPAPRREEGAWEDITSTPCTLGMQDKFQRPLFPGRTRPFAVCGIDNEDMGLDLLLGPYSGPMISLQWRAGQF
ncbi:hypothetical protein T484DRAFT_2662270 [Baffinella frigidus]|nr:hypothetical protein T484DRAFT_2662270 [Cryptophyta sp. CCMP2293]